MLNEYVGYLFHLIRFGQGIPGLEVKNLGYALPSENMMTTFDSLGEAKPGKQSAQVAEADVRIRRSPQDS
jgi:hypothetical protein